MSMIIWLVEKLRNLADYEYAIADTDTMEVLNDAADVIEELSAKLQAANMERSSQYYNGGWISVKDKLPEDFKDVLVWYEYFRYGDYNRMVQTYGIGCYISNLGAWSGDPGTGTMAKVIAWQPLPTPPESEGKE